MGYTTDFEGQFTLDNPLTDEQREYLHKFNDTRRMDRDSADAEQLGDSHKKVGLDIGVDGEHFVDGGGSFGQGDDSSVMNSNRPPRTQPGLWCQWTPNEDGDGIEWDGGEKFYNYVEWIEYIIEHFLKPWGHNLNGEVKWYGEENGDMGKIVITDNEVKVMTATFTYE